MVIFWPAQKPCELSRYPLDRAKHAEVLSQLQVTPETLGKATEDVMIN